MASPSVGGSKASSRPSGLVGARCTVGHVFRSRFSQDEDTSSTLKHNAAHLGAVTCNCYCCCYCYCLWAVIPAALIIERSCSTKNVPCTPPEPYLLLLRTLALATIRRPTRHVRWLNCCNVFVNPWIIPTRLLSSKTINSNRTSAPWACHGRVLGDDIHGYFSLRPSGQYLGALGFECSKSGHMGVRLTLP